MMRPIQFLLVVVAPLVTMGAGCSAWGDTNTQADSANRPSSSASVVIAPGVDITKTGTETLATATQGYVNALDIYEKNGARFEFVNCTGNPGALTVKRGERFMIDNRDNVEHQIGVGPETYPLAGRNFAIITLQNVGSFNVTCDGRGEAHVEVEN